MRRNKRGNIGVLVLNVISKTISICLLPTGSEKRGELGVGSIPVAILPSCQKVITLALQIHKHENSRVVKIKKNTSKGSTQVTILPLAIILTAAQGPWLV